jgi:hypothetical protein
MLLNIYTRGMVTFATMYIPEEPTVAYFARVTDLLKRRLTEK